MSVSTETLLPFPFPLPPHFLRRLGYERAVMEPLSITSDEFHQVRRQFGDAGVAAFKEAIATRRPRRFVGLWSEQQGSDLAWADGWLSGAGQLDTWAWRKWLRAGGLLGIIGGWLVEHEVDLGNVDGPATQWLVVDRDDNRGWTAPRELARRIVRLQRLEPTADG